MVYITWTIVKLVYMPIYYPQPWSSEVCCWMYPKPKVRDISSSKLPLTSVLGSIFEICTSLLWFVYYLSVVCMVVGYLVTLTTSSTMRGCVNCPWHSWTTVVLILSHLTCPWLQFAVKMSLLCWDHPLYPATTWHQVCMMMSLLLQQKGQST